MSAASRRPELSAILLCYRAEEHIKDVFEALYTHLTDEGIAFEVVLVANYDADASDRTPAITADLARSRANVRQIARPKEGAMGWDMRSGLAAAEGDLLIVIDGDGQNPPETVRDAYRLMRNSGADVLKGRRVLREDGFYRRLVSFGYNALFRVLFSTRGLWDINGKPKGLTRNAFERLDLVSDDWFIDAEIVLKSRRLGFRIVELPVRFSGNQYRASFVRWGAIFEFLRNLLAYRFGRRR